MHQSFCTPFSIFQYLHALHANECAYLAVDHEVEGAVVKEEDEDKVLFSGLLKVSR